MIAFRRFAKNVEAKNVEAKIVARKAAKHAKQSAETANAVQRETYNEDIDALMAKFDDLPGDNKGKKKKWTYCGEKKKKKWTHSGNGRLNKDAASASNK